MAALTPGAPVVASAVSFEGFEWPLSDRLNPIIAGFPVPLSFDYDVPNLSVCNNAAGTGCVAPRGVSVIIQVACPNGPPVSPNPTPISVSKLLNFGKKGEANLTEYFFFWNTVPHSKGCTRVVLTFDAGLTEAPAEFKYFSF